MKDNYIEKNFLKDSHSNKYVTTYLEDHSMNCEVVEDDVDDLEDGGNDCELEAFPTLYHPTYGWRNMVYFLVLTKTSAILDEAILAEDPFQMLLD